MATDHRGRELFDIICDRCKKKAQVPFKPRGDKPVYCRDCFAANKKDDSFFEG